MLWIKLDWGGPVRPLHNARELRTMVICESCQTVNHPSNPACTSCGAPLGLDPALEGDPYIGRSLGGGRFRLDSVVGSGELGMVYAGTDARTHQAVAVKIVHPDVAATHGAELLRSAGTVARLRHAKIATVLAAAREGDGTTFIVTEFVEGETLKSMLGRTGPLGPRRAADILFQLCSALAPFHRANRPHANLKPENVFIAKRDDGSDMVKIVDAGSPDLFGVRELDGGHVVIGNPKYFSPEQVLGEVVGLPSDLFTLGVIGYQLLTGALPFYGATPDQLLDAIVNNAHTPVEQRASGSIPPKLAEVIQRCLAKHAADRPKDLRQVATVLAQVIKTTQAAPKRKRKPFGMPGGAPSTVVANIAQLEALDDDDDDATVARGLDAETLAALQDPGPDPVLLQNPAGEASIPEPLMFTGAFDGGAMRSAIEEAVADATPSAPVAQTPLTPPQTSVPPPRVSNPPAPPAPSFDSDLKAALDAASADTPPPPPPKAAGGGFDPFASLPVEHPSAPPSPPPPDPVEEAPAPSPNLASAILDAMDDVRPTRSKAAPAVVAPLATAADFEAIAPSTPVQRTADNLESLPPAPPTINTRWLIVLTCLLLAVGGAAFVYINYIDVEPTNNGRRRPTSTAAPKTTTPKSMDSAASVPSANPGSTPSAAGASAGSATSGAPASAASDAPKSAASDAPKSAASAAPKTAAPAPVAVTIISRPKGAAIFEGKSSLGTSPITLTLKPGERRSLTFKLKGHEDRRFTVAHGRMAKRAKDGKAGITVRLKKKELTNPYLENPY